MKFLFLFIDGVGMADPSPDNPVNPEVCPVLCRLIARNSVAIDARLGVEGIPQSATGQATIFTGINCAERMGRHCEGFPGPALREIIEKDNLFLMLERMGKSFAFANAYLVDTPDELKLQRFKSVTTVMSLTTPQVIRTIDDLYDNRAVVQDITRETIQDHYPDIPVVSPQKAAEHLFSIARENDFTFFEFFQTDVSGHSLDYARACAVLRIYDRFLGAVCRYAETFGITVVITADHGNIECMSSRSHTLNKVPFIVYGPNGKDFRSRVSSLVDVTPFFVDNFLRSNCNACDDM